MYLKANVSLKAALRMVFVCVVALPVQGFAQGSTPASSGSIEMAPAPAAPVAPSAPIAPVNPAAKPSAASRDDLQFLSTSPKTLTALKLHPAVLPSEAELRCSYWDSCIMGLTRGFAVSSDVAAALTSLVVRPQIRAGGWLYLDGAVSFQFLDRVDNKYFANGTLGYRTTRYRDSSDNEIRTGGFFGRFNYAQDISPMYTQGVSLAGTLSPWYELSPEKTFFKASSKGKDARRALEVFYGASHRYPNLWLSFPADFEIINWKASHIDTPSDLHGYAHVEPFFAQNEFRKGGGFYWGNPPGAIEWIERNFGSRAGLSLAYESASDRVARRFGINATLGFEVALTNVVEDSVHNAEASVEFELPERPQFSPYGDLMVSWQF